MSAPTRPVLRYHGGKFRLAPWILTFFPSHVVYVEPFGGAASVLLQKPRVGAECYNDLDGTVVNLFRLLRDPLQALELQRLVELTPFARQEFDWAYEPAISDMDAAHKTIVKSFMGHGSDSATRSCRTGFRSKLSDGRVLPSVEYSTWSNAIPSFTNRLQGVVIENRSAIEVIERMDSPNTLIYADPPYCHSTRSSLVGRSNKTHGYRHEMTDDDHRALAGTLRQARGMVVLSGYPSQLYDEDLYPDWIRLERRHVPDGGKARTEVVWINPACAAALEAERTQGRMFA
ncbi:D12 class N6 adenine-specific DNA methyltransferase [Janthinobacterium sp. HH104]|uniref:DNA adenine methylase n=1 Tax=Janthinobacterium sp. HH104 TaxID=1537276 RepID=UPI0008736908|nr:DNA adenine methylase [Janthinobacterium sp. HH104]OEZ80963.1 D12 class N6 adenine-specific DNA methyltransferase [Janthinobacterium sp. HH104]